MLAALALISLLLSTQPIPRPTVVEVAAATMVCMQESMLPRLFLQGDRDRAEIGTARSGVMLIVERLSAPTRPIVLKMPPGRDETPPQFAAACFPQEYDRLLALAPAP